MSAVAGALLVAGVAGVAGLLAGLARLARASRHAWSDDDFAASRRRSGNGLLAVSMRVLEETIGPGGRAAAEARQIVEAGQADESARAGDGQGADRIRRTRALPPPSAT